MENSPRYLHFLIIVAKKVGVPDLGTKEGYEAFQALCPGKTRVELSELAKTCTGELFLQNDTGQIDCVCRIGNYL